MIFMQSVNRQSKGLDNLLNNREINSNLNRVIPELWLIQSYNAKGSLDRSLGRSADVIRCMSCTNWISQGR